MKEINQIVQLITERKLDLKVDHQERNTIILVRQVTKLLYLQALIRIGFGMIEVTCGLYGRRMIRLDLSQRFESVSDAMSSIEGRFEYLESECHAIIDFEKSQDQLRTYTPDSPELAKLLELAKTTNDQLNWKYQGYQFIVDYGSFKTLVTLSQTGEFSNAALS